MARSWALLSAAFLIPAIAHAADLEEAVLDEVNYVRAHPAEYAGELRRAPDWAFEQEEPGAVAEAIDFLERQPPLPPLKGDARLDAAARVHARAQGGRGDVGHGPAGSLGVRLRAAGVYAGLSAENISYGSDDAPGDRAPAGHRQSRGRARSPAQHLHGQLQRGPAPPAAATASGARCA
ncbi:CAP domain-containing protein [Caulobacter segnis]